MARRVLGRSRLFAFVGALVTLLGPRGMRGQTCTLTCPKDVTLKALSGQNGIVFTFSDPVRGGDCGAITCSPASGSFFPVGTTTVACGSATGGGFCEFTVTVLAFEEKTRTFPDTTTSVAAKGTLGRYTVYNDVGPKDQWLIDDGENPLAAVPHPRFFALDSAPAGGNRLAFLGHNFSVNQAQVALINPTVSPARISYYAVSLDVLSQGGGLRGDGLGNLAAWSIGAGNVAFHRYDMADGQFAYLTQATKSSPRPVDVVINPNGFYVLNSGSRSMVWVPANLGAGKSYPLNFAPTSGAQSSKANTILIGDANQPVIREWTWLGQEVAQYPVGAPVYGVGYLPTGCLAGFKQPRTVALFGESAYADLIDYTIPGTAQPLDFKPVPGKRPLSILLDLVSGNKGVVDVLTIEGVPADRNSAATGIPVEDIRTLPQSASASPRFALLGLALIVAGAVLAREVRKGEGR